MELNFNTDGLIPAVVQDAASGELLMMAWMNVEALQKTQQSGEAHFWSRSRNQLWHKGATSGNVQKVREIRVDCDQDTLLLLVEPAGPACHTGRRTCFYRSLSAESPPPAGPAFSEQHATTPDAPDTMSALWSTLLQRRDNPPPASYTAELLRSGDMAISRKVGEEALELILAAAYQGEERLLEEAADLTYHLLVLLLARGLSWEQLLQELASRHQPQ